MIWGWPPRAVRGLGSNHLDRYDVYRGQAVLLVTALIVTLKLATPKRRAVRQQVWHETSRFVYVIIRVENLRFRFRFPLLTSVDVISFFNKNLQVFLVTKFSKIALDKTVFL